MLCPPLCGLFLYQEFSKGELSYKVKNCQILPAGKYLTAYHVGHWNTIGETYERMLNYKKQHQLKTSDLYIEYDVVNNFITKSENEFVSKVEVEIIE